MKRQIMINLEPVVFDYISSKAHNNNESLSAVVNRYIMQAMTDSDQTSTTLKRDLLRAATHNLRGVLKGSPISDKEAKDEYLKEKYGL